MKAIKTIGIDARFWEIAGPGRYVKNIVEQLEVLDTKNRYLVFLSKNHYHSYVPKNPNFQKVVADYKWYSFDEQIRFLIKLLACRLDLLYVPHFNVPVLYPGKLVTAIADIIMHTYSTEAGTTLPKPYFKLKKWVYSLVVSWVIFRAIKVIVPSNVTRQDILKTFPWVKNTKLLLAYEGVDGGVARETTSDTVLKKFHIAGPFILYVGSMYKHKNVEGLVKTFKILKDKFGFTGQLVFVGKKDKFSESIFQNVLELGLSKDILMPGLTDYVTDSELAALRKKSLLYVFPSFMEGFSLTPLEALAVGLPCAISDIPCHREVYKDAVLYFNPYNGDDMARKINIGLTDVALRQTLVKRGYGLVPEYKWENTARATLAVFDAILKSS